MRQKDCSKFMSDLTARLRSDYIDSFKSLYI